MADSYLEGSTNPPKGHSIQN